ncbi:MAG: hypothetical protein NC038_01830 [Paludibacter sp.]|nr:hypothetical protein [Bacteroidales bacterium]MCM1068414.1 hypothetical protein [Prevotella sp.]MCM1353369.1 hypothetical protein [Bacteroides sp.]MCM1442530.1 hypothetical protein [Muribaculum sp.]MCM1481375.1 hypothetical protein [Paludibacter sp.]
MEKLTNLNYINIILLLVILTACESQRSFFPKNTPEEHVNIVRFDSALLHADTLRMQDAIHNLNQTYPLFMPIFCEDILGIYADDTTYLAEALPKFLNDTLYGFKQTNAEVLRQFANIQDIQQPLNKAFGKLRYLYPDMQIPTIYFFVSGFNASLLFVEDDIAVGVDMYLGSDYSYYNQVVYNYQKQTMRKECIATDITSAWLFRHIPFTSTQNRLLENMIYRGKIMYLLSLLFPEQPSYEIMGYTRQQGDWCKRNEAAVWQMMIDKKDLFRSESLILTSYLNDGPFTSEISQEAPSRLGTWIGWQICRSYMQHNKNVTLQQLMEEGDAQHILQQSWYKP